MKQSGFKCRTVKRQSSGNYVGVVICVDEGRRMWSQSTTILRLSRGDALQDAQAMARDYINQRFDQS